MPDEVAEQGYELYEAPAPAGDPAGEKPPAPESEVPTPEPEGAKPEGEEKPEGETPEGEEKPHKKSGSARARERAEREAALRMQAEQELADLKAKMSAPGVADAGEPQLENFEDFESWRKAFKAHAEAKAEAEVKHRIESERGQHEAEQRRRVWQERDAKLAAEKADWDDTLEDLTETVQNLNRNGKAPGFDALDFALSSSELSAELKYHFGKNPDELRRMANLDPINAVKALARLEDKISQPAPPKPTTKAPAPARPVAGSVAAIQEEAGYEVY